MSFTQECPQECSEVVEYSEGAEFVRLCVEVEGDKGEWTMVDLSDCQLSTAGLELCEASLQVCTVLYCASGMS